MLAVVKKPTAAEDLSAEMRAYFAKIGRKGGLKGGKARWKGVSKAEHSEAARKAVKARWAKKKRPGERGSDD